MRGVFTWWISQEGLFRPRKVLEQMSEVFEDWTQLGGIGSWWTS